MTVGRQSSLQRHILDEKKIASFVIASLYFRRFACPNKSAHKFAIYVLSFCR